MDKLSTSRSLSLRPKQRPKCRSQSVGQPWQRSKQSHGLRRSQDRVHFEIKKKEARKSLVVVCHRRLRARKERRLGLRMDMAKCKLKPKRGEVLSLGQRIQSGQI